MEKHQTPESDAEKVEPRTMEEVLAASREPPISDVDIYASISSDGKSPFVRIPAKIRDQFHVTTGKFMRFHAKKLKKGFGPLQITVVNKKPEENDDASRRI